MAGKKLVRTGPGLKSSCMKPKCRVHVADMVYVPDEMSWCCLVDGCETKRRPKIEGDENVTVITDDLKMVMVVQPDKDGANYFLRSEKHNLLVNVTSLVSSTSFGSIGCVLNLSFPTWQQVDV